MKGDENLFFPRIYTENEIREKWPGGKMHNDRVRSVSLEYALVGGGIVGISIIPTRFCGCFCAGYVSTANVGHIAKTLIQVLGIDEDFSEKSKTDHFDIVDALKGAPFRVYNFGGAGDRVMETTCIGHFLNDSRFVYCADLMKCGLPKAIVEAAK